MEAALAFAEALAPEHLQLAGDAAEALAPRIRSARAACSSATARAPRSATTSRAPNHTLPTEGAARFASGLNVRHFRRRMAEVRVGDAGARAGRRRRADRARPRASPAHAASMAPASESTPVTRTARSHRKTGETDVSLTLGLAGTGAGTRSTGVGFFDHMLDLLARHGRLELDVQVTGDLQTGVASHGRGHGHRARAGARPGARRPARDLRYGHAVVPMDEARATCAIDISGRPYTLRQRASTGCRPARSTASSYEVAEEFFRAVASAARLTLHIELQAGHERATT